MVTRFMVDRQRPQYRMDDRALIAFVTDNKVSVGGAAHPENA